jgi:hypothetical protein
MMQCLFMPQSCRRAREKRGELSSIQQIYKSLLIHHRSWRTRFVVPLSTLFQFFSSSRRRDELFDCTTSSRHCCRQFIIAKQLKGLASSFHAIPLALISKQTNEREINFYVPWEKRENLGEGEIARKRHKKAVNDGHKYLKL